MDKTVIGESSICEDVKTVPSSPTNQEEAREGGVTEDAGVISELYSLNRDAKDVYHLLARYRNNAAFNHYCHFIIIDTIRGRSAKVAWMLDFLTKQPTTRISRIGLENWPREEESKESRC